jgi:hypothetical protein
VGLTVRRPTPRLSSSSETAGRRGDGAGLVTTDERPSASIPVADARLGGPDGRTPKWDPVRRADSSELRPTLI